MSSWQISFYLNTLHTKYIREAIVPDQTKGWCFIFFGKLGSRQVDKLHVLFLERDAL